MLLFSEKDLLNHSLDRFFIEYLMFRNYCLPILPLAAITYSNLTIETLEQGVKYVQSQK